MFPTILHIQDERNSTQGMFLEEQFTFMILQYLKHKNIVLFFF